MSPFVIDADPAAVAAEAESRVLAAIGSAQRRRGRARLVLAGGSTPRALYERLAARPERLDWDRVDFFFGDERCVPPDDARSNHAMARATLLDPLRVVPSRIHRIPGERPPDEAAVAYEDELRRAADPDPDGARFDLVLLGLGADGHTASLFPGGPELDAKGRLAIASRAPTEPRERVTMTPGVLGAARGVLFLVTGEGKAEAVARAAAGDPELPACRIDPVAGERLWLIDRAAASRLPPSAGR